MDFSIRAGSTSRRIAVFIQNASTGEGLTGLTNASSGLVWYYWRETDGNVAATQVTSIASMTKGTWTTKGFVEKDSTGMKGWYELGIPDAVLATGTPAPRWVKMRLEGASNMVPLDIHIELDGVKNEALAELTATPTATPTVDQVLMLLYMWYRNRHDTSNVGSDMTKIYNDAGTVVMKRDGSDDTATFTRDKLQDGP